MSFFSDNATFNVGGEFEVAEAGVYACRLKEVEKVKQPSFEDPTVMVDKFRWVFETNEATDTNGNPYRFSKFTGTSYGNDRAALTLLIDGMAGKRLTSEQFGNLSLENLKKTTWRVMVEETQNQKGNAINKIISVKQQKGEEKGRVEVKPTPAPTPKPKDEEAGIADIDDPFAD